MNYWSNVGKFVFPAKLHIRTRAEGDHVLETENPVENPVELVPFLVSVAVVMAIRHHAREDIEKFRTAEMNQVKAELKNYLDIAYESVSSSYHNAGDNTFLQNRYGQRLKNIIDLTEGLIEEARAAAAAGTMSLAEAQRQARAEIGRMRYDGGTGYIWINDMGQPYPKMVMHPTVSALDGQVLDLIEKTIQRIDEGDELTRSTESSFSEVTGMVAKVSALMGENRQRLDRAGHRHCPDQSDRLLDQQHHPEECAPCR